MIRIIELIIDFKRIFHVRYKKITNPSEGGQLKRRGW